VEPYAVIPRVAGLALAIGLAVPGASAHPLSRDQWSLRTAVRVARDDVQVIAVLEVPFDVVGKAIRARREAAPDTPVDQLLSAYGRTALQTLASQATLTIDGQAVQGRFVAKDHPLNGRGSASGGFFTWFVEFRPEGAWPLDGDVTVGVAHGGYTDVDIVYSTLADAGPGWTLAEDSSRQVLPDRPYRLEDPAFWSPDPRLRTLTARFVAAED